MEQADNSESSSNRILWLWIPDLRALGARLSGTTAEIIGTTAEATSPTAAPAHRAPLPAPRAPRASRDAAAGADGARRPI